MIELIRIPMQGPISAVGCGRRAVNLAKALGFSTEESTRMGVATFELAGRVSRRDEPQSPASVAMGLKSTAEGYSLVVEFTGPLSTTERGIAEKFFDRLDGGAASADQESIQGTRQIPDSDFSPSEAFVSEQKAKLASLTKSELMLQLKNKNAELKDMYTTLEAAAAEEQRKNRELVRAYAELEKLRRRDYELANFDRVTGLPNRVLLEERITQALNYAERHRTILAIMFMDLDFFKDVNDTAGHAAGDAVLQQAGKRMQACIRKSDTVARLGGDEFVVLIQALDRPASARGVAEKLLAALRKPFSVEGHEFQLDASIGVSVYPHDTESAKELIKFADEAMYAVKRAGRQGVRFHATDLDLEDSASGHSPPA